MKSLNDLTIQLYADGADKAGILDLYAKPYIKGLTTNPSLMKKAGIHDYEAFAKDILQTVTAKPISLEVFTDDFPEMKRQALKITAWGKNVYTKIWIAFWIVFGSRFHDLTGYVAIRSDQAFPYKNKNPRLMGGDRWWTLLGFIRS